MLLLLLPLLLGILKMTVQLLQIVNLKQDMRAQCFSVSLGGLRAGQSAAEILNRLTAQLPNTAVTPVSKTATAEKPLRRMVFNLKNDITNFNCGAEAQWKNQTWDYAVILDKF